MKHDFIFNGLDKNEVPYMPGLILQHSLIDVANQKLTFSRLSLKIIDPRYALNEVHAGIPKAILQVCTFRR